MGSTLSRPRRLSKSLRLGWIDGCSDRSVGVPNSTSNRRLLDQWRPKSGEQQSDPIQLQSYIGNEIAIVGMSARFPGAPNLGEYWRLLVDGIDAISGVPRSRWDIDRLFDEDGRMPGKMNTRWGGFIEEVDLFEPEFFGISPRETEQVDPQQRLMLELVWWALEDAGIVPSELRGTKTGIFVGAMWADYGAVVRQRLERITPHSATGQDLSIIPARVSYTFGFEGPSLLINTACSSSLVAVHLACQSLRLGKSSVALVGGVNLMLSPESTVMMSKFGAMAPDGRSKAFDARANGYVRGEGGGVVVLKPLQRALHDGDSIYCVVRGSAVNNDGFSNGLTAPSPKAQKTVLREAYHRSGVHPRRVQFVETHGTGTLLGDPIEAQSLGSVLGAGRSSANALRLGSVKTNIGHLEAAAGIAGLIKTALALSHRVLPPNLHFDQPNPNIDFKSLGLEVQRTVTEWPDDEGQPLAGVSSFGFGGTNCHVVLGGLPSCSVKVFPFAAHSLAALRSVVEKTRLCLSDARTGLAALEERAVRELGCGSYRAALTVRSLEDLNDGLSDILKGRRRPGAACRKVLDQTKVVFMFAGQGSQWVGMGRELIHDEPVVRASVLACAEAMSPLLDWSLIDILVSEDVRVDRTN